MILKLTASTRLEVSEAVDSAGIGVAITLAIFVAKGFLIGDKLRDFAR